MAITRSASPICQPLNFREHAVMKAQRDAELTRCLQTQKHAQNHSRRPVGAGHRSRSHYSSRRMEVDSCAAAVRRDDQFSEIRHGQGRDCHWAGYDNGAPDHRFRGLEWHDRVKTSANDD